MSYHSLTKIIIEAALRLHYYFTPLEGTAVQDNPLEF